MKKVKDFVLLLLLACIFINSNIYGQDKENINAEEEEYLKSIKSIGSRFLIRNVKSINTELDEFAPVRLGDRLIFTGSKRNIEAVDKKSDESDIDIYVSSILTEDGSIVEVSDYVDAFSKKLNTKLYESTATFSKDGKKMFFSSNTYFHKKKGRSIKKSVKIMQIFEATLKDDLWKDVKPLPFCSKEYSVEHASLNSDGTRLYFSSDMPGGYGSFDIYYVDIKEGRFGTPVNLGDKINTSGKEHFPFISEDNKLYFSSDGRLNFGGLDIYVSQVTKDSVASPDNVGLPVNSPYDDCSYYIDSNTSKGFFASNRPGGEGGYDIYQIKEQKPLIIEGCTKKITVQVKDKVTNLDLKDVKIYLEYFNKKIDTIVVSDSSVAMMLIQKADTIVMGGVTEKEIDEEKDVVTEEKDAVNMVDSITKAVDGESPLKNVVPKENAFKVKCDSIYSIRVEKYGYQNDYNTFKVDDNGNKDTLIVFKLVKFEGIVMDEAAVFDEIDAYKMSQATKSKEDISKMIEEYKQRVVSDSSIVQENGKIVLDIDKIYFDYNQSYIRLKDKSVLDKAVAVLKRYKDLSIEMTVHSDMRGTSEYNMQLSKDRASSIADYLFLKGIDAERIISRPMGEESPIIDCTKKDCTEEDFEINRRSEFILKGY